MLPTQMTTKMKTKTSKKLLSKAARLVESAESIISKHIYADRSVIRKLIKSEALIVDSDIEEVSVRYVAPFRNYRLV